MNHLSSYSGNIHLATLLFTVFHSVFADIAVISPDNKSVQLFIDYKISYTSSIPDNGILGYLVRANPPDACTRLEPASNFNRTHQANFFLLADRSTSYVPRCNNRDKIQHATEAGYKAVILYSPYENYFQSFSYFSIDRTSLIPSVLISHEDGEILNKHYLWPKNYKIFITSDLPPNLSYYLLPFAVVIGVCLVLTISFMIFQLIRCVHERSRVHRHRLPKKFLKKLPLQKVEKGICYETCAICLEDYVEGEKIRILPCNHAYHMKCIDPWLTQNRRVCPFCKCKIRLPGMPDSDDSDSETDNRQPNFRSESLETSNNERTGLLRSSSRSNRARTRPNFGNFFNILNNTSNQGTVVTAPANYGTGTVLFNDPLDDRFMIPGPSHSSSAPVVSRLTRASQDARNKRRSNRVNRNHQVVTAEVLPTIAPSQPSINCDTDYEPLIDWDESSTQNIPPQQLARSNMPSQITTDRTATNTTLTIANDTTTTSQDLSDSIHHIV